MSIITATTCIPPGVQEVMGSIPVGDSDFFFVPYSCHVDHFIFFHISLASLKFTIISLIINKINWHKLSRHFWSVVNLQVQAHLDLAASSESISLRFPQAILFCSHVAVHQTFFFGQNLSPFSPAVLQQSLSSFHSRPSVLMGTWNGASWLGCRDLAALGVVFYLGDGWLQGKPLDTPGTHPPFKKGARLNGLLHHMVYRGLST